MIPEAVKRFVEPIVPSSPRVPWKALISILGALLYGASPLDLIPDLIPLLGWFDDGVVTVVMTLLAIASLHKWSKAKRAVQAHAPVRI